MSNRMVLVGIGLAIGYWLIESAIHAFVFHEGGFVDALYPPETGEFWMRSLPAGLLIAFGVFAQLATSRRRRVEQTLRENDERYRMLFERNQAGVYCTNLGGDILDCNESMATMFGYASREELLSDRVTNLYFDTSDREAFIARLREKDSVTNSECRMRRKDGTPIDILENVQLLSDKDGAPAIIQGALVDITERKQAEKILRQSEARYQELFDSVMEGIGVVDENEVLRFCNPAYVKIFEADSAEELLGRSLLDYVLEEERDALLAQTELRKSNASSRYELCVTTNKNNRKTILLSVSPRFDERGRYIGAFGTLLDVTVRKRAEEARLRLGKAVEQSIDGIAIADKNGKLQFVNPAWARMHGREPDELLGKHLSIFHTDTQLREEVLPFNEQVLATGAHQGEVGHVRKDGTIFPTWMTTTLLKNESGDTIGLVGTARDINERKLAEKALRESEERLRQIAETIEDVFWISDWHSHKTLFASQAYERIWGRTLQDLYADAGSWTEAIHPEDRERAWEKFLKLGEGDSYDEEYRIVRPDGDMRWVRDRGFPVRDANGQLYRIAGIAQDISARKQAETERERLLSAIEQAAETIMITDVEAIIQYVNPAFERITGYSRDEAVGQNPRMLKSGVHDVAFYKKMWDTLTGGETWSGRIINKKKDGTPYTEEGTISPMCDPSGQTVNYVAVKRDVTNEIMLETQLLQAQKMEAIGQLAGGVAHDFNNILTAIMGNVELSKDSLRTELGADHEVIQSLEQIEKAAERASALTRQLLIFSRRDVMQPTILNLNDILTNIDKMLQRLITEDIRLETIAGPDLKSVRADAGQLEQVIVNLVVNAVHAMPDGGRLTLETQNVMLGEDYTNSHAEARPGPHVLLAVSDTGFGMDAKTLERIFEPFFTTKPVDKGTGLGLATVHGIVKQSGGHVMVYSEPGSGTTFKVYLPTIEAARDDQAPNLPADAFRRVHETILLCEDDQSVRKLTAQSLRAEGYRVITADSVQEALEAAQDHAGDIDLLITDVIMPDTNGRALSERLCVMRPDMPTLYISGYTSDIIAHHGVLDKGVEFLEKPFTRQALLAKIRTLLNKTSSNSSPEPPAEKPVSQT